MAGLSRELLYTSPYRKGGMDSTTTHTDIAFIAHADGTIEEAGVLYAWDETTDAWVVA